MKPSSQMRWHATCRISDVGCSPSSKLGSDRRAIACCYELGGIDDRCRLITPCHPSQNLHHDWPPSTLPLVAPGLGRSLKRTMCKLYSLENDWSTPISKINDIFFEQQKTRRSGLRGGRGEGGYLISLRLSSDNLPSTIASLDVTVPSLGSSTP